VAASLRWTLGSSVTTPTDIVGYPIHAAFDVHYYFENYVLAVAVFPAVAFVTYLVLTWAFRRLGWMAPADGRPILPMAQPTHFGASLGEAGRSGLSAGLAIVAVAALWAAGIAMALDVGRAWLWLVLPAVVVTLATGMVGVARAGAPRLGVAESQLLSLVNALVGALSALVLLIASESTEVVVESTGRVDPNPLLPAALLALLAVGSVALVGRSARRGGPERWPDIERRVLTYLVAPIGLFLTISVMAGPAGALDFFHEGESLGASRLIGDGRFPWRDLLFIHGLLEDVGIRYATSFVLGDSRWALIAGHRLFLTPLFWLAGYLLAARLFRSNPRFLVATQVLVIGGFFPGSMVNVRLALVPIVLLLLAGLLDRDTWSRVIALVWVAGIQLIVAPDSTFATVAALATVVVYDVAHHIRGTSLRVSMRRTLRCVAAGVIFTLLVLLVLILSRSLGAFVSYYRIFAVGHELSGGIPIIWSDWGFTFWVYAPVLAVLVGIWFALARLMARKSFTTEDWVVGAAILGLVPFYVKFLSRGDGHIYQVADVALVPLLWIAFRVVTWADRRTRHVARRVTGGRLASTGALLAVVLLAPTNLVARAADIPDNRVGRVPQEPELALLGYQTEGAVAPEVVRDVGEVVERLLPAGGSLFDFTNSPALFSYLLDVPVATRYFHVSMAIPRVAQDELIRELRAERPEVVVFSSIEYGLPVWDGIANHVRHYAVSAHLLDRYRPVEAVQGYVFMLRNDLVGESAAPSLYFGAQACDWGYALESLTLDPPAAARWTSTAATPIGSPVDVAGWAVDPWSLGAAEEVLVAYRDVVIDRLPTGVTRRDVVGALNEPGYVDAGFEGQVFGLPGSATGGDLRFYAVTALGRVVQLTRGAEPNDPEPDLRDERGRTIQVEAGPDAGNLERADRSTATAYEVPLPSERREVDWIEVVADGPIGEGRFELTDGDGAKHEIAFQALGRQSDTYRVPVGSCPQWFGYGTSVVLVTSAEAEVTSVRFGRR
jgi:hypothetical protein